MQMTLNNVKSADVVAYFIWLPCIRNDSKDEAVARVLEFADPRVRNYWDEDRITGNAWQERLSLPSFAWDVYFLFDRSASWQKGVPQPTFWMHQLSDAKDKGPFLDQKEFESRLRTMVASKK
jgi:hypothetical protein